MNFYQVNQRDTFEREFNGGYLCCPAGNLAGWPLMRELQPGDVVSHYNSAKQAVLGISRVSGPGRHRGTSEEYRLIDGTVCIAYRGCHLSEADFDPPRMADMRSRYSWYYEVHTVPILKRNLGRILPRTPQAYLVPIDNAAGMHFLSARGIASAALSG